MAALTERQAAERKSLERLSDTLDKRAHDLESLMQVLAAARDFSGLDPVEHVRVAMRHYVREQPQKVPEGWQPVPEGWQPVPVRENDEMRRAWELASGLVWTYRVSEGWRAMVAGAPKPGGCQSTGEHGGSDQ